MGDASYLAIFLFFLYTWGIGFAVSSIGKKIENFWERNIMRIGFGLAALPLITIILSLLHIPVDWRLILFLSLACPAYQLFAHFSGKNKMQAGWPSKLKLTKSGLFVILVLLMFIFTLFMYVKGAHVYPYFEDDDPWSHAVGVAYVAEEKTVFNPDRGTSYLDPYPPGYDAILGILKQTSHHMMWTVKFFNALMISLGIFFIYYFAKKLISNSTLALFATVIYTFLPSTLSHFIWAHSLVPGFFMVIFYAAEHIKDDPKYIYITSLVMSGVFFSSFDQSIKLALFFIPYLLLTYFMDRKAAVRLFYSGAIGLGLMMLWIFPLLLRYGSPSGLFASLFGPNAAISARGIAGSADRSYSFDDIVNAKMTNMINSPIGIGLVISALVIAGLTFCLFHLLAGKAKPGSKDKNLLHSIILSWLLMAFFGLYGIPMRLIPFRWWMLLAIPVSILAAYGLLFVLELLNNISKSKAFSYLVVIAIIVGVWFTSGIQKYTVNTAVWPPGAFWSSNEEIQGYLWVDANVPDGARVFPLENRGIIVAFDKYTCAWCPDENAIRRGIVNTSVDDIYKLLKERNYEYALFEGQIAKKYGGEAAQAKLAEFADSGLFEPIFQNPGLIVFRIK
ncbi:MAG: hypothetical protein QS98_C0004G0009 [archaeon GW2011_AR3]|nr:MAG: hypothetical protein QS98_C0004G0009 [archaeon GW2011_AR3]MBS3109563.1 hypothetical protein [Candidatus Woesearchaeota archaeon]